MVTTTNEPRSDLYIQIIDVLLLQAVLAITTNLPRLLLHAATWDYRVVSVCFTTEANFPGK